MLDMRTLMITFVINSFINTLVMFVYWKQNRVYFKGIFWWVLALSLQTIGFLLLGIRGLLPDFITIVVSNTLIVYASFLLYMGLKSLVDVKTKDYHNYVLIVVYAVMQYVLTFIQPSGSYRIILISVFTSLMFFQSGMLMLRSEKNNIKSFTKITGTICYVYILVQLYRIFVEIIEPTTDYFNTGLLATSAQLINQFMTIAIVFSFIVMVNSLNLHNRVKNENELKESEKKLKDFINHTYDWELWINNDENIEYMSPSVERITGYKLEDFMSNNQLIFDIIHHEDLEKYKNHLHEENCSLEYKILDRNGDIHWIDHVCQRV